MKTFLLYIVVVEHVMKFLKIFLEYIIWDTPEEVANGEKERRVLE